MKLLRAALLMVLVSVIDVKCESVFSYSGYKVYDVKAETVDDASFLKSFDGLEGFDFWSMSRVLGSTARVMVAPEYQQSFDSLLGERNIEYKISISDLEKTFAMERQNQLKRPRSGAAMTFDRYYRHDEINDYLESLPTSGNEITVQNVGKSYEGRDIKTITITNGDGRVKNSIFIDAGIHAREWIAPSTALFVIASLVDPQSNYSYLLNELDFVIMPVLNPDGYEYTHKYDRMWRKTRSSSKFRICMGTDGNRNFDFHWGEGGASTNACSETYRGSNAFSEVEARALRDTVMAMKDNCKFYLTLHSSGNYLLYPWGYTSELPETWKDLDEIAQAGAQAIENATGTKYTVGSSTNVLYIASGGSDDYMLGVANIPISITMELPSGGFTGFDPPASSIQAMVEESAIGIFSMAKAVAEKYNNEF